jgi:HEAT repeat protein
MKTWSKIVLFLGLLLLFGLVVYFEPTRVLLGSLRSEKFYLSRPTSYWEQALLDTTPGRSTNSAKQLADGGEEAVPVLLDIWKRNQDGGGNPAELRLSVAQILGEIGPKADPAVSVLVKGLQDPERSVRAVSSVALGKIGTQLDVVVPAMARMLGQPGDRLAALKGIWGLRAKAKDAIPAIAEVMRQDDDGEVRWHAAEALAKMGAAAQPALPHLIAALSDPVPAVRTHAAESLRKIGPEAQEALPSLTKLVNDPDAEVRNEVRRAIESIKGK